MANQANIVQNDIARAIYLVDANGNPVTTSNPLGVNASFSASSIAINDPNTTTNKATVDGSGNLHVAIAGALAAGSATIGGVKLIDTAGTNVGGIDSSGNLQVKVNAALPAGTAVIGHVIVDSAGSVSITSLPSIPAGTNVIGHVIVDSGAVTVSQADLTASGTISAAQPVIGTPVSNATVVLAVGQGQSTWKAQLLAGGGGFTSGTTIVADKSPDGGTTWYSASFKVSGAATNTPVSSVAGPGPLELTGNAAGVSHVRIRCSVLNSTETIAVTLRGGAGIGDIGLLSPIPAGSNTIGSVNLVDSAGTNKASVSAGGAIKVDNSGVTQPVSAASLPLPSGAATSAKQPALGTAGSASADVLSVQGIASMTPLKVDGSGVTQPVSAASLPLPTGAAQESGGNLATLAGAVSSSKVQSNVSQINGVTPTMGNGVSGTGVQRVTIASDSAGQVTLAAGSALVGTVEIADSAGSNKLAIDSSGRLTLVPNSSVNVAQIGGVNAGLDNTNELKVSNYVKSSVAGDTALTLGQATMANSLPVTMASNQGSVGSVTQGAGASAGTSWRVAGDVTTLSSLSAGSLNADLLTATDIGQYGYATLTVTGTWTGTLSFQYSDDNSTFTTFSSGYNSGGVASGSYSANNQYVVKGFAGRYMRIRMTSYTSGTANATLTFYTSQNPLLSSQFISAGQNGSWSVQPGNTANTTPWLTSIHDGTNKANVASIASGQNGLITAGGYTEQASLSAGSLNADLVASTDVSSYKWLSLHINTNAYSGTLSFQCSNDNANWIGTELWQAGVLNSAVTTTTSTNIMYIGPVHFRYLRVRMTSYTSGTAQGTLELYTSPSWYTFNTIAVTQSGSWAASATGSSTSGTSDFHLISANTTNATSIKASAGQVYGYEIYNSNAAARFVKLYNKASSPTVGTDAPFRTIGIAPNSRVSFHSSTGLAMGTGIALATTTGIADSDSAAVGASDLAIEIDYK